MSWFPPRCPLSAADKSWVEDRLNWLCAEFGDRRFTASPPVLPTRKYFSATYDGPHEAVEDLYRRVCYYMDIPPETVELGFCSGGAHEAQGDTAELSDVDPEEQSLFEDGVVPTVYVEESALERAEDVVAILAHELSRVRLLSEGRVSPDEPDTEALTDLTAIFFGLGIFSINRSTRRAERHCASRGITQAIGAYALAHHAWARNEQSPEWLQFLRGEGAHWCKASLEFLFHGGDSDFCPLPPDPFE